MTYRIKYSQLPTIRAGIAGLSRYPSPKVICDCARLEREIKQKLEPIDDDLQAQRKAIREGLEGLGINLEKDGKPVSQNELRLGLRTLSDKGNDGATIILHAMDALDCSVQEREVELSSQIRLTSSDLEKALAMKDKDGQPYIDPLSLLYADPVLDPNWTNETGDGT